MTAHQYARLLIPQICQESSGEKQGRRRRRRRRRRAGWIEGESGTDRCSSENNRMYGRGSVIVGRQLLIG